MMPWIELIEHPLVQRIGWVLLHFFWQGAAIALAWGVARALLRGHDPRVRYGLACLLLGAMIAAPVVTFHLVGSPPSPAGLSAVMPRSEIDSLVAPTWMTRVASNHGVPFALSLAEGAAVGLERVLPWLVILWWAGVCGLSVRLLHGYWRVRDGTARRGLAVLNEEFAKQEHQVGRLQTDLDEIRGELGISESMMERDALPQTADPDTVRRVEAERITVEAQ